MSLHPIVAQMRPNAEQAAAILAPGRAEVVTAGAGTGKTRTLVGRYLSLLAAGRPLREVAAITFTRKAAQELRNRIRGQMRAYLQRPDLEPAERRLWDGCYTSLDAARIGTIHTLCAEILRAHPAELGLDPRFDVLEEAQAALLSAQAVEETLAWAADQSEVAHLFSLFGEAGLRAGLARLLAGRLEVAAVFGGPAADPWPLWQAALVPLLSAFVDDPAVAAGFDELLALEADGTLARAAAAGDRLAAPLATLLDLWRQVQAARQAGDWAGLSALLPPLRANLKQVGRQAVWAPAQPKLVIASLQAAYDAAFGDCFGGKPFDLGLDRRLAAAMPGLRLAFDYLDGRCRQHKAERGALDFDDLEGLALQLLNEQPAALARWRRELSAILVDEYQDTNGRQRDLINLLAGAAGDLFIVGDAKQSIYRFRGAEVAVFRQERARIGRPHTLAVSYRAHQALIAGLNALLRPVLGDADDPARPWREPFAPLAAERERPACQLEGPFIELHLAVASKSAGGLELAAAALAARLSELVAAAEGCLGYGDIAILCRASSSFAAYEDALDAAGIPYLTLAGRGFYERPEVRDLLNALQALADPSDDLALAGLLRSPVVGFSDAELFDLCRRWAAAGTPGSLWAFLQAEPGDAAGRAVALIAAL
ncbi:MAG: UvrD-helicase domain-containing protein, partial [Candidatus Promineifilaceae bacterium]